MFAARNVKLVAPPKILKEKHVKLRLASNPAEEGPGEELSELAVAMTPRCHPDSAAIRRREKRSAGNTSRPILHTALGWRLAERVQQAQLLPGDCLDIAFTLDHNDHPDFGGLELTLRDFKASAKLVAPASSV